MWEEMKTDTCGIKVQEEMQQLELLLLIQLKAPPRAKPYAKQAHYATITGNAPSKVGVRYKCIPALL
jgi:hypothetical protein